MADLDVQLKKKSLLPWILLAIGIIALIFFMLRSCNTGTVTHATGTAHEDSGETTTGNTATATTVPSWDSIDFTAEGDNYPEISGNDISGRGNSNYGIYGLGENILFDEGKSDISTAGEQSLKQVASSIDTRYKGGAVRVYGYTDAIGSEGYNKQLAEQRADAVANWLVKNGNVSQDNISKQPVGEARPVASNATSEGRKQNRRVEIVARNNK